MTDETVLYEATRRRGVGHAEPAAGPQQLHPRRCTSELWAALDRIEADKAIRALVITGAGTRLLRRRRPGRIRLRAGSGPGRARRPGPADRPGLQSHGAQAAGAARADGGRGQRRRRRRRRFAGDDLRPGGRRAGRELHPGLQQDRPGARCGWQLVPGQEAGPGARHGLRHAGRQGERARMPRSGE